MCPTRGRPSSLIRFINSVFTRCDTVEDIELILIADTDDLHTNHTIEQYRQNHKQFNITHICKNRSDNLNRDYYLMGAGLTKGEYIWGLGDDTEIKTQSYDYWIKKEIGEFVVDKPDKLCYYWIRNDCDADQEAWWRSSSFPIFNRVSFETTGCTIPPEIPGWGADNAAQYIWTNIWEPRVCFSGIKVLHHSQHSGRATQDETNKIMQARSGGKGDLNKEEAQHYIGLINAKIQSAKSS